MFSSNQDSIKSSQKDLVMCHLVEFFFLTLNTCSSFPNNSLTHGFSPTDNCCHRICNKGYKVSKNKEDPTDHVNGPLHLPLTVCDD